MHSLVDQSLVKTPVSSNRRRRITPPIPDAAYVAGWKNKWRTGVPYGGRAYNSRTSAWRWLWLSSNGSSTWRIRRL